MSIRDFYASQLTRGHNMFVQCSWSFNAFEFIKKSTHLHATENIVLGFKNPSNSH